jgi:hypothetical protein
MAVLMPEDLGDLQTATLKHFERRKFTEISTDISKYHVFPNLVLFKDEKGKASRMETRKGGTSISFRVMVNHSGAARNTGMAAVDAPVKVDVLEEASVPWRFSTTQYGMLQQELAMNSSDPEQIVSLYDTQDKAALISLAELMENNFWGPPVESTDETTPYGVFTWFSKGATTGFNGAFPSGFTSLGLDNEHPRWKHYTAQYTNASADDLFRKMWIACLQTDFESPVPIPSLSGPLSRGIYTNTSTYVTFCEEAKRQNDNIGYDLTYANGQVAFMGSPVMRVPKLDADTTDPVVGINWGAMKCIALQGWWLKRLAVKNYPGQHTVDAYFIDCQYNFLTWNRRTNFVMAKGTTYPS